MFTDKRLQCFFVIWKEWKKVLGVVNVETSRLVVVSPEGDLRKHGLR